MKTSPSPNAVVIETSHRRREQTLEETYAHRSLSADTPPFLSALQKYAALTQLTRTSASVQSAAQQELQIQELSTFGADGFDGPSQPSASPWVGLKVSDLPGACSVIEAPSLSSSYRSSTVDRFCAYAHRANGREMRKVPLRRVINSALSGAAPYRKQVLRGHPVEVKAQVSLLPPPEEIYTFLPQVHHTEYNVPKLFILCSILGSAAVECKEAGTIDLPYHTGIHFSDFMVLPNTTHQITLAGETLAAPDKTPLGGSSLIVVEVPILHATASRRDLDTSKPLKVMIQGYHAAAQPALSENSAKTVRNLFQGFKQVLGENGASVALRSNSRAVLPFWATN